MDENEVRRAQARWAHGNRIIVDRCPYCFHQHTHMAPVGEGKRTADCDKGEYVLVFEGDEQEERDVNLQ